MMLLLLLVGIHVPDAEVSGAAGEHIAIGTILTGNERVRAEGSGTLDLLEEVQVSGKTAVTLRGRIHPAARPGTHHEHLYIYGQEEGEVVVASAFPMNITVRDVQTGKVLAGTAETMRRAPIRALGIVAAVLLVALLLLSVRVSA